MSGIINATNLEVANIKDSTGTNTAMTVSSGGHINLNKNLVEYWYFNGTSSSALDATLSSGDTLEAWGQDTRTGIISRNAGMSHSSGVWTFPHDGLYKITVLLMGYASTGARPYLGLAIDYSTDSGSSYTELIKQYSSGYTTNAHFSVTAILPLNITASSSRCKINYIGQNTTTIRSYGSNQSNSTRVLFEQIG